MTPPDPELVRTAVEAVRAGASLREVAEQAGVSHMTVRRWVAAAGTAPRVGRPPTLTPAAKAAARARKAQGATTAQVAAELGVSRHAVDRVEAAAPPAFAGTGAVEPPPEPPPALTPVELARDHLEVARETYLMLDAHLRRELAAGNSERVSSLMTRLNAQLDTIRKIEESRRSADGADVVTFTREQLEQGARVLRERLEALAADRAAHGGLTCVGCGERLRLAAAEAAQGVQGKGT